MKERSLEHVGDIRVNFWGCIVVGPRSFPKKFHSCKHYICFVDNVMMIKDDFPGALLMSPAF